MLTTASPLFIVNFNYPFLIWYVYVFFINVSLVLRSLEHWINIYTLRDTWRSRDWH